MRKNKLRFVKEKCPCGRNALYPDYYCSYECSIKYKNKPQGKPKE